MATRPLRQFFSDSPRIDVADDLGEVVGPWTRHRRRLEERLSALTEQQWVAPSRCDAWSVRDVVSHLVTVDQFWMASLGTALSGTPSSFLVDFNPSTSPEGFVAPMRALPESELLSQFSAGTDALVDFVAQLDGEAWQLRGESPLGHMPLRLVLAHAFWDSWLHERDIFVALDQERPVESDELAIAVWYVLVVGAIQGGLIDDPEPVGSGLEGPIEASLSFDDLPDDPIHLVVDQGVRLERGGSDAVPVGSALAMVETLTGRRDDWSSDPLPPVLAAHIDRAMGIL